MLQLGPLQAGSFCFHNQENMARDAYYVLTPLAVLALGSWLGDLPGVTFSLLLLGAAVAFFFRDPDRSIPDDRRAIVSPADGKIIRLEPRGDHVAVSIFLSVLNVHVTRAPIGGVITEEKYRPGQFRVAYDERASVENEQLSVTISGEHELTFSLIAGIVARRIRFWKKKGQRVGKGDRIGLIRFGSRVDIILPPESEPAVKAGDRVTAGTSVIAYWKQDL